MNFFYRFQVFQSTKATYKDMKVLGGTFEAEASPHLGDQREEGDCDVDVGEDQEEVLTAHRSSVKFHISQQPSW